MAERWLGARRDRCQGHRVSHFHDFTQVLYCSAVIADSVKTHDHVAAMSDERRLERRLVLQRDASSCTFMGRNDSTLQVSKNTPALARLPTSFLDLFQKKTYEAADGQHYSIDERVNGASPATPVLQYDAIIICTCLYTYKSKSKLVWDHYGQ